MAEFKGILRRRPFVRMFAEGSGMVHDFVDMSLDLGRVCVVSPSLTDFGSLERVWEDNTEPNFRGGRKGKHTSLDE